MKTHQEIRDAIEEYSDGVTGRRLVAILHALNDRISAHVNVQDERIAELERRISKTHPYDP